MENKAFLNYLKRVEALAKIGLSYSDNPYDLERYEELKDLTLDMLSLVSKAKLEDIQVHFELLDAYPTPQVDVRGFVMKDEKVLLIKEAVDHKWALPGGWCEVGLTPQENVVKEVREEAGLDVRVDRLLAVWDKKCHDHPADIHYVYKLHFLCTAPKYELDPGHEALGADYFALDALPQLSLVRTTESQIRRLYALSKSEEATAYD